jgi:hypothetical protein
MVGFTLAIITLVDDAWLEQLFNVDADRHSGSTEGVVVGCLLVVSVLASAAVVRELKRVRTAAPATNVCV